MCSIFFQFAPNTEIPVILGVNRDENLHRKSRKPHLWKTPQIIAPQDLNKGGTWIGIHQAGHFAALTNRFGQPSPPEGLSRGDLTTQALELTCPTQIQAWVAKLDLSRFGGFHLLWGNLTQAVLIIADHGKPTLINLQPGKHLVAESSAGANDLPRLTRLEGRLQSLQWDTPTLMNSLDTKHVDGFSDPWVHIPQMDYGTRCSQIIRLHKNLHQSELYFREQLPQPGPWQNMSHLITELVAR
ncbi:MAG: NRDE family protein [Myxococcota bacterium]|nr:NRDE family protein [Myxococcota bacterium]